MFGSLGSWRAPWLAASEPSLVIIRWHLCGKKGFIARRGSPQPSVCLSVCPSVTSGSAHLFPVVSQLLTVNSWLPWDLMMSREREGHPGARAHARVVRAVMPRSRATRVGAHPFLPLPLHSVELASQPVPKSRPAVPATVSPLLTMGPRSLPPRRAACPCLPPHHTAWIGGASTMTPASSGEAVALGPWDRAWCPPGSQQASSHSTSVS